MDSLPGAAFQFISCTATAITLYLTLAHATSAFYLPLTHQHSSSSRLQYSDYSRSASTFSLSVSTTIPDLTILEFIFWTTKLRKQLYKNLKYNI
jgi:hypothetical protein